MPSSQATAAFKYVSTPFFTGGDIYHAIEETKVFRLDHPKYGQQSR
jgi:hypothetical protein